MSDKNYLPWEDSSLSHQYIPPRKGEPDAIGCGKLVTLKLSEYEYESIDCFARSLNRTRHGQIKQIINEWLNHQISKQKKPTSPYGV